MYGFLDCSLNCLIILNNVASAAIELNCVIWWLFCPRRKKGKEEEVKK